MPRNTIQIRLKRISTSVHSAGRSSTKRVTIWKRPSDEAMASIGSSSTTLVGQIGGARSASSFSYNSNTFTVTATYNALPSDIYTLTLLSNSSAYRSAGGILLDGERNAATTVPSGNTAPGGDFVLHFSKAFAVTTSPSTISGGDGVPLDIDFNGVVDPASVQASDLLFDGQPVALSAALLDADTVRFLLPARTEGAHTITFEAGAITSAAGLPVAAFNGSVISNSNGPRVVSTSVQQDEVRSPVPVVFTASFDEVLRSSSLFSANIELSGAHSGGYLPASYTFSPTTSPTSITANYASSLVDDIYTIRLNGSDTSLGITDPQGALLDGSPSHPLPSGDGLPGGDFVLTFSVDAPVATPIALSQRMRAGTAS